MSYKLTESEILFQQRILKASELYTGKLDGIWGIKTDAAFNRFNEIGYSIQFQYGKLDSRSEANIVTLIPKAQILARKFLLLIYKEYDIDARIISGTRTYEEQSKLYAQGRSKPGSIVTNAKAGQSNHNFGIAFDIGIFDNGRYVLEDDIYIKVGKAAIESLMLEWGGNWKSFKDYPHYQLKTIGSIRETRIAFEKGKNFLENIT